LTIESPIRLIQAASPAPSRSSSTNSQLLWQTAKLRTDLSVVVIGRARSRTAWLMMRALAGTCVLNTDPPGIPSCKFGEAIEFRIRIPVTYRSLGLILEGTRAKQATAHSPISEQYGYAELNSKVYQAMIRSPGRAADTLKFAGVYV